MMPPSRSSRQVSETLILPLLCLWGGGNDLSYLNHIIIAHYNASYGCGKCLKQDFVSSLALHYHKKVCIELIPKKSTRGSGSKPSSGGGGNSSHGGSSKATPKKDDKAPATDSQGSSAPPASQTSPHCSGQETLHHHKSHKNSKDSGKKPGWGALPGRAPATRCIKMVAAARLTAAYSPSALLMPLNSCILSIKIAHVSVII